MQDFWEKKKPREPNGRGRYWRGSAGVSLFLHLADTISDLSNTAGANPLLTFGERQCTPRTCLQPITGLTHRDKQQLTLTNNILIDWYSLLPSINLCSDCGREPVYPEGNPRRPGENMQTVTEVQPEDGSEPVSATRPWRLTESNDFCNTARLPFLPSGVKIPDLLVISNLSDLCLTKCFFFIHSGTEPDWSEKCPF